MTDQITRPFAILPSKHPTWLRKMFSTRYNTSSDCTGINSHAYQRRSLSTTEFLKQFLLNHNPRPSSYCLTSAIGDNIKASNERQSESTANGVLDGYSNYHNMSKILRQPSPVSPTTVPWLSQGPAYMTVSSRHDALCLPKYNTLPFQSPAGPASKSQTSRILTSISTNYQGDPYLKANQSADIPDELNTSLWITNLPPDLNHKMLLDSVRDCGKVYAAVINAPGQGHITCASKIVFFDVAGAENLLRQAHDGAFIVGGYKPRVRRNRIKTEARPAGPHSRVLRIEGPSCIVNYGYLRASFGANGVIWQNEAVLVLASDETTTRLEWRFGSYRCQAESARYFIERMKYEGNGFQSRESWPWQGVTVHFGVDPCAPKSGG
ncbi:hypothetical protein F4802DRAFT_569656 [Xylaria palmicola]|nr:hypothetical protein F4802DRAFT_569656 [Xylaria palmicola]